MQIWAEPRKSALPICNYSQILYQFLTFTQNLKRSPWIAHLPKQFNHFNYVRKHSNHYNYKVSLNGYTDCDSTFLIAFLNWK